MLIYEPLATEGYEWVNCCRGADYEVFWSFDGSPRSVGWAPVRVRRVRADKKQECKLSDFPWLGAHALVMRRQAVECLGEVLRRGGEILPLATDDGTELFVLNATRVLDAIDAENSEILRFPGSDRIMRIKRIAFIESVVTGIDFFRLPHRTSPTFVGESFVDRVEKAGLVGLDFVQVWSSTWPR